MTAICGEQQGACTCDLGLGHDGPHLCSDRDVCQGSWGYDENGEFIVYVYPGGLTEEEARAECMKMLLGALGFDENEEENP